MKDYVKPEPTDISLTRLEKNNFYSNWLHKAEVKIDNSKFEISSFAINDNSSNFDLIIGTDIIQQGKLNVSDNDAEKKSMNLKMNQKVLG